MLTTPGGLNTQMVVWMEQALPALLKSPWEPALRYRGINAGDILFSPLYEILMRGVRTAGSAMMSGADPPLRRVRRRLGHLAMERRAKARSSPLDPVEVLFWPRLPSHVRQQVPVARALYAKEITFGFVACQARVAEALHAQGVSVTYAPAAWPQASAEARAAAVEQAGRLDADPGPLPDLPVEIEREVLVGQIRRCLKQQLVAAYQANAFARKKLDAVNPDVLVVGNDVTIEGRAGVLAAQARRVKTAMLMHGTVAIAGGAHHRAHLADQLLVYGETDRAFFLDMGLSPRSVIVCGAPYLDDRPRQTRTLHPAVRRLLGDQAEAPYVLVATSGPGFSVSHRHHEQTIETVMRLSARMPDVAFIAKLHPKDRLAYYRRIEQRVPASRLRVVVHGTRGLPTDIFDWLQGCRAVLTGASTVAREAMLMEVPVVTMDFADEIHGIDFIEAGATRHVATPETLERAVRDALERPMPEALAAAVERYLSDSFFALDGQSARRCAAALIDLAERGTHTVEA